MLVLTQGLSVTHIRMVTTSNKSITFPRKNISKTNGDKRVDRREKYTRPENNLLIV